MTVVGNEDCCLLVADGLDLESSLDAIIRICLCGIESKGGYSKGKEQKIDLEG